eukprot:scaffold36200_cov63-Phaeocystis_antarctica.AAC.4
MVSRCPVDYLPFAERGGAGGGPDAAKGREHDGLLRRVPQARQAQALSGAGEARCKDGEPRVLRHRRGGGAARRTNAGGAGGGAEGCSGAAADERGGAAAGAGGGPDAARGREQGGLLRREAQARQAQALYGAGDARWQGRAPGHLRHRRGGGAVRRTNAGGEGGGGEGCSGAAADERGGAAAGAGGGDDAARGREQDGLLRRAPQPDQQVQAIPDACEARWQAGAPGQLRHRRGGGAVRRAVAGGADGGAEGYNSAAADERGGAAAGAGGGADAARGREQDGLPPGIQLEQQD